MIFQPAQRVGLISEAEQALIGVSSGVQALENAANVFSTEAVKISTDVSAMRESVDLWMKIIGGTLIGIGGVLVLNMLLSRKK